MRKTLFIPGPSEVEDNVLSELSKPVIPHYGREWAEFYENTCDLARKIFDTEASIAMEHLSSISRRGIEIRKFYGDGAYDQS